MRITWLSNLEVGVGSGAFEGLALIDSRLLLLLFVVLLLFLLFFTAADAVIGSSDVRFPSGEGTDASVRTAPPPHPKGMLLRYVITVCYYLHIPVYTQSMSSSVKISRSH